MNCRDERFSFVETIPRSRSMLVVADRRRVILVAVDSASQKSIFEGPHNNISCVAATPDGQVIVGTSDGAHLVREEKSRRLAAACDCVAAGFVNGVGVVVTSEGQVLRDNGADAIPVFDMHTATRRVVSTLDGEVFAFLQTRGDVRLLDWRTGEIRDFLGHDVTALGRFEASNHLIAVASDGSMAILDVNDLPKTALFTKESFPVGEVRKVLGGEWGHASVDSKRIATISVAGESRQFQGCVDVAGGADFYSICYDRSIDVYTTDRSREIRYVEITRPSQGRRGKQMKYLLHISDFHFRREDVDLLIEDVRHDVTTELKCTQVNAIVASGDFADQGIEEGYRTANRFLEGLISAFGVPKDRVVLVPGNHDVNFECTKSAFAAVEWRDKDVDDNLSIQLSHNGKSLVIKPDLPALAKKFDRFSGCLYSEWYGVPYPNSESDQYQIFDWPDIGLICLGLNTAHPITHFSEKPGLAESAIAKALRELQEKGLPRKEQIGIVVWHHPIAGIRSIEDGEILRRLSRRGFKLGLHGDSHVADAAGRWGLAFYGAGAISTREKVLSPGVPRSYNLLSWDPSGNFDVRRRAATAVKGPFGPAE